MPPDCESVPNRQDELVYTIIVKDNQEKTRRVSHNVYKLLKCEYIFTIDLIKDLW